MCVRLIAITRYYGEEIGDEVPNYAAQVTNNCGALGLCDDHVARTSAKILGVTVTSQGLSADQLALMQFHQNLMNVRSEYPALSHGMRQNLYSDDVLYVDLKTYSDQQVVFATNTSDQALTVQLNQSLFSSPLSEAWDNLTSSQVSVSGGSLSFVLAPLSGSYILVNAPLPLPGDYNHNNVVDAADYVVWRKNVGASTALPNDLAGGTIGTAQYNQWRVHFGQTAPGAGGGSGVTANAVAPEPTTLVLMMFATAGWYLRHASSSAHKKTPALPGLADSSDLTQLPGMAGTGFEPATSRL